MFLNTADHFCIRQESPAGTLSVDSTGGHHIFPTVYNGFVISLVKIQCDNCAVDPVLREDDHFTYICSISIAYSTISFIALWAYTLPATKRLKLTSCLWTRKRKKFVKYSGSHSRARTACKPSYWYTFVHNLTKDHLPWTSSPSYRTNSTSWGHWLPHLPTMR